MSTRRGEPYEQYTSGCSGNITRNYCSSGHRRLPLPVPVLDDRASHLHCRAVKPATVRLGSVINITIAHVGSALDADAAAAASSVELRASAPCRLVQCDLRRLTSVSLVAPHQSTSSGSLSSDAPQLPVRSVAWYRGPVKPSTVRGVP
jgi:hypothetical protein